MMLQQQRRQSTMRSSCNLLLISAIALFFVPKIVSSSSSSPPPSSTTPISSPVPFSTLQNNAVFVGQYHDPSIPLGQEILRVVFTNGSINMFYLQQSQFSPGVKNGELVGDIVLAEPADACSPLTNVNAVKGNIVLIQRGTCSFQAKSYNAQVAQAAAVVIYNNVDGMIMMASDGVSPAITIPSFSTLKSIGLALLQSTVKNETEMAIISPGDQNPLRVTFTATTSANSLEGFVEYRSSNDASFSNYGRFSFLGTYDAATGLLTLNARQWMDRPYISDCKSKLVHNSMFSLIGYVTDGTVVSFHGVQMPPFAASFHLRLQPNACQEQLAFATGCQSSATEVSSAQCGSYVCTTVTDLAGFRIFNDQECPNSPGLVYNCEEIGAGSCQGATLRLPTHTPCTAAGMVDSGYLTDFPVGQPLSSLSSAAINISSSCSGSGCKESWQMRGNYLYSGKNADSSESVITFNVLIGTAGGSVSFNYKVDGERNFDYLTVSIDQFVVLTTRSFTFPTDLWLSGTAPLTAGYHVIKFSYYKDFSLSYGLDGVFIRSVVIQGGANPSCRPCPAGSCADTAVQQCNLCPAGQYNDLSGQSTCRPCQNAAKDPWTEFADGSTTSVCPFSCHDGYEMVGSTCQPIANVCYLEASNSPLLHSTAPPNSFAMLQQCLSLIPHNTSLAGRTIDAISTVLPLYPYSEQYASSWGEDIFSISSYKTKTFKNDYDFHSQVSSFFRSFNDPDLIYVPPQFYSALSLYLPWSLDVFSSSSSSPATVYIDGMNAAAIFFGYNGAGGSFVASDYLGFEVVNIDGLPVTTAISKFAETQVGISEDLNVRFNLALNSKKGLPTDVWEYYANLAWGDNLGTAPPGQGQTMYGMWSCAFTYRNLALCGLPAASSVRFDLRNPKSGAMVTVNVPWSVMFTGNNRIRADSASDLVSQVLQDRSSFNNDQCGSVEQFYLSAASRFWPNMIPLNFNLDDDNVQQVKGGSLKVLGVSQSASAYLHTSDADDSTTAILELRQLSPTDVTGLRTLLTALRGANAQRLVVDVRDNIGGDTCLAHELAYVLSSSLSSPNYGSTSIQFRVSDLLRSLVQQENVQSTATTEGVNQFAAGNFGSLDGDYQLSDIDWVNNPVRVKVGSQTVNFTQPVRRFCESQNNLLSTGDPCCGTTGMWGMDVNYYECRLGSSPSQSVIKSGGFDPSNLIVLSNGLCTGACAVFLKHLTFVGSSTIASNMASLACQMKRGAVNGANLAYLPIIGQDFRLPIAQVTIAPSTTPLLFDTVSGKADLSVVEAIDAAGSSDPDAFIIGSLPAISQEFQSCEVAGQTQSCTPSAGGGLGVQTCTAAPSGGKLFFSSCNTVRCLDGFYLDGASQKCQEFNFSKMVEDVEGMLGGDSDFAREARKQLTNYLTSGDPSTGGGGGGGYSPGSMAAAVIFSMIAGGIITICSLYLYSERAKFEPLYDNLRHHFSVLRQTRAGPPTSRRMGSPGRGSGGGAGGVFGGRGSRSQPMDLPLSEPAEVAPAAEGRASFLDNLKTRRSVGSSDDQELGSTRLSSSSSSVRSSKAKDPRSPPTHEEEDDHMSRPMLLHPLAQDDDV